MRVSWLPPTLCHVSYCFHGSAASNLAFSLSFYLALAHARARSLSFSLPRCSNNIKSIPEELGALTKLREVYFNGNPISTLPAALAGWGSLEEGSFKFCKLKALPP
jgi:Leucine-rich repeat (LRR) protein